MKLSIFNVFYEFDSVKLCLQYLVTNYPKHYLRIFNANNESAKFLRDQVKMHFSSIFPDLLKPEFTDKTRIYWLITGMTDYCHCKVCNKPIVKNINRISIGYSNMTCSPECI